MRLLLDEMLWPGVARELRRRGLDALAVAERPDLRGLPDAEVLGRAVAEGRAIVTGDVRDYRVLVADNAVEHFGLVLVPSRLARTHAASGALADALERIATEHDDLRDREIWL